MYTLQIKENRPQLEITLFRALLALAALASLVLKTNSNYLINVVAALLLFLLAVSIDFFLVKKGIKKYLLLLVVSAIILLSTHSPIYALIFFSVGLLASNFNQSSQVDISSELIQVKKGIFSKTYLWKEFSNVVLKDELITLDFTNNRLIQLMIDSRKAQINETAFNDFCSEILKSNQPSTDPS